MSGVSSRELASAAGLSNFLRTIAGSISTAVCIWMWNDRSDYHHGVLIEHITPDSVATAAYQGQLAGQGFSEGLSFAYIERVIGIQATTMGANDVFLMLSVLYLMLIPFVWLARPPFGAAGGGGGRH